MKKLILLIFIFTINSCFFDNKEDCSLVFYRFEQEFFNIEPDSFDVKFNHLKNKLPNFFIDTTLSFNREVFLDDTLRNVLDSVNLVFRSDLSDFSIIEEGFCNYNKYFPTETLSVYTFIDKVFDYRTPVVFAHDKLFISLHLFLGENHSFYNFLPDYIKYSHDKIFLPSSCFNTLAGKHIPYPELDNFLDIMMYYSKSYFFTKTMLPSIPDYQLFKCPEKKIKWCNDNESAIWRYMIDRDYLFSSSSDLIERFIDLAPFSQFGLSSDVYSPGGVGVWLGFQIWNAYVENNNLSLIDVLTETDYKKVLNKSGYKP